MIYVSLPLYTDADYQYEVSLEKNYYTLRLIYNEREGYWYYEFRDGENSMLVAGEKLVPLYPMNLYYNIPELTGFLWLEPIGESVNETVSNPFELSQYYRLYYIRFEEEELLGT